MAKKIECMKCESFSTVEGEVVSMGFSVHPIGELEIAEGTVRLPDGKSIVYSKIEMTQAELNAVLEFGGF